MMDKLEQLRAKPDHVKRMIAAGAAGGITFVIVIFWVVSLSITTGPDATADAASAQIAASPFTTLSASVADAFAPITSALRGLKNSIDGTQATSSNAIQMYSPAEVTQQGQAGPSAQQNGSANMNTINQ